MLGYIYEYSENLLLTILLHFGFNSFSLFCMQGIESEYLSERELDLLGNYIIVPLGIVVSLYVISRKVFWVKKSTSPY